MRAFIGETIMNIRQLCRMGILIGLPLLLAACTGASSPQAGHTPTVNASIPTPTATTQPSPTPIPSPSGGTSTSLGPLPQTCPVSSISTPKTISPAFGPMVGAGSAWGGGINSYKQVPLALVWSPGDAFTSHTQHGWRHKLLWVVSTPLPGNVTIQGANLSTGAPLYPNAEYASAASTATTLVLNPSDPTVLKQDANRDAQWTQFPGGLTVPAAGCYSLQATWPGGSWQITFAAGLVPSLS